MKKWMSAVLAAILMVSLLGGCAGAEGLSGELVISGIPSWIDETSAEGPAFLAAIERYEELNPGVTITAQSASQQDIKEAFQTAALAGGGPDVVTMDNCGHAIDLAAMGLLLPPKNA